MAMYIFFLQLLLPAAADPSATIAGAAEVVFFGGMSNGSCADYDIPDAPARAWRSGDGVVHLAASWATLYMSSGKSLLNVKHSCAIAFNSTMSGINSLYSDHEWLVAPWVLEDNRTVMGYMHQEFHGWQHNNCSFTGKTVQTHCWMVAMTSTISTDGGRTFQHTHPPPSHLVAAAPYPYLPDSSGFGYGDPSGIVRHQTDGYLYMTVHSRQLHGHQKAGTCIMRTNNPRDIHAWRGWNGSAFVVEFVDPYADVFVPGSEPAHVLAPIPSIQFTVLSLKWSTYFKQYLAVGQGIYKFTNGTGLPAYVFALSDDLLHWGTQQLIRRKIHNKAPGSVVSENYASVLDPLSDDVNFNTVGKDAYFYYTRQTQHNTRQGGCKPPGCRDLMREPISFAGAAVVV